MSRQTSKTSQHASIDAFTAIAHPVRRKILDLLAQQEMSVIALAKPFDMSRPAISQHLRVLLEVGLVDVSRVGREQRYRLRAEALAAVYDWVAHYTQFWQTKLGDLGKYLEENNET